MKLALERTWPSEECTIGALYLDDKLECFTLEDVVREIPGASVKDWKIPGATAIPAGLYQVVITPSPRFGRELPLLLDVPGFEGVRIHPGNTAEDTEGCILLGTSRGVDSVHQSRKAFEKLFVKIQDAILAGEDVWLDIT